MFIRIYESTTFWLPLYNSTTAITLALINTRKLVYLKVPGREKVCDETPVLPNKDSIKIRIQSSLKCSPRRRRRPPTWRRSTTLSARPRRRLHRRPRRASRRGWKSHLNRCPRQSTLGAKKSYYIFKIAVMVDTWNSSKPIIYSYSN